MVKFLLISLPAAFIFTFDKFQITLPKITDYPERVNYPLITNHLSIHIVKVHNYYPRFHFLQALIHIYKEAAACIQMKFETL